MKIKRLYPIGAALSIAATLGLNNFASAVVVGTESISLYYKEAGQQEPTICLFYDADGISEGYECPQDMGSFNSRRNTLTLRSGVNGLANSQVKVMGMDGLMIVAEDDLETNIYAPSIKNEGLTLDFSTYSFTDALFKDDDSSEGVYSNFSGRNLTIQNGVFDLRRDLFPQSLEVDNGVINMNDATISTKGPINILGGEINSNARIAINSDDDINISGGTININNAAYGITSDGDTKISGGKINIKPDKEHIFGIYTNHGDFIIEDGELTIEGFEWCINNDAAKIYFNGGVTTLKNNKGRAVVITNSKDPYNDIVFGENMGIKEENVSVFIDVPDSKTGITGNEVVTIAEGYTVRKYEGSEQSNKDDDKKDEGSAIKVPDTGAFSNMDDKTTVVLISLGALAMVSGLAYLIAYAVKRLSARAKFNR